MNRMISINARFACNGTSQRRAVVAAAWMALGCLFMSLAPELAFAGASPFTTGATATQTNVLAILTPIAVVAVMAIGAAAWFNKISWGWGVAAIVGICLVFGAPQIVTWARGMFGV